MNHLDIDSNTIILALRVEIVIKSNNDKSQWGLIYKEPRFVWLEDSEITILLRV